jgi:hypothetical protein
MFGTVCGAGVRVCANIFNQYLRHTALPVLELSFAEAAKVVRYRWQTDEADLAMPISVGTKDHWQKIKPTTQWQEMKTELKKEDFQAATDLYFIDIKKI